ncbi:MAG: hypothetical protein MJ014_06730 [Methanocorpusculum sp.]|nr:hypothetical protein [Methanocorpusculum sp.]
MSGAAEQIRAYVKTKWLVIGVCGGIRCWARRFVDNAIEGYVVAEYAGLGLLPVTTRFDRYDKVTGR